MKDYSKSHIYNIYCNDTSIKNHYVGSSNCLLYRKRTHKSSYNNENCNKYNIPLYQFIRSNGGWDNFSFEVLEEYPCVNSQELLQREDYWIKKYDFDELLNCRKANRTTEELKEYKKKYNRQYYIDNAIPLRERNRQYYIDNKEKQ